MGAENKGTGKLPPWSGWTTKQFQSKIEAGFDEIKELALEFNTSNFYWLSMNSEAGYWSATDTTGRWTPMRNYWPTSCEFTDARTPFILEACNRIAHDTWQRYKQHFGYIDNYKIVTQLAELAFDASHFLGMVGGGLARNIINVVCDDPTLKLWEGRSKCT